jgi:aminoglycoside phosphotransferase (APT) family kinase protein
MEINRMLVKKLVSSQFPEWESLSIEPVKQSGWDNRTFHLGEEMTIRLPSAESYAPQILKEFHWLPILAKNISCQITMPLALGQPCKYFPWHWSINRWIEGETASVERIDNLNQFALDLGTFLTEFQSIDSTGGPIAGAHNFYRGGALSVYDDEMRLAISKIENKREQNIATQLWTDALSSQWERKPVWVHGDIAMGNLLVHDGKLHAVIDFGQLAIGDPACDLAIAWNLFSGESRTTFQTAIPLDRNTWVRALGWTFWKTLCWPVKGTDVKRIIQDIFDDYQTKYQ